jgi:N-methylhydantoinase A
MPLDAERAHASMANLGERIGRDAVGAASSVLDVVTANMYAQLLPQMARKGVDPRDFALVAYGGAGPTQACLLARELGIKRVVVPRYPGLLCAYGSLVADLKSDFVATLLVRSDQIDWVYLEKRFAALEEQARRWLRDQTGSLGRHAIVRAADMRYKGQSFEVTVVLDDERRRVRSLPEALAAFHEDYEAVYSQSDHAAPVEFVNIRVTISGETPRPAIAELPAANGVRPAWRTRDVFIDGAWQAATVYEREELRAGQELNGPAVVEQDDTTVLLPAGTRGGVDRWANILVEAVR